MLSQGIVNTFEVGSLTVETDCPRRFRRCLSSGRRPIERRVRPGQLAMLV
jgi:hypothetical protein